MSAEILVTGGDGLLASAFRKFCPEAVFVGRKECDLTDGREVENLFARLRPKHVLHLAAKVAGVKTNAEKNADMFAVNVQINTNLLRAAQEHGVETLVGILSSCAWPDTQGAPVSENDLHQQMPFPSQLGYGYSKRMLDVQIHLLYEQYGCRFTTLTPMTLFGPYDNWDLNEAHVVGALIHKCFLAKRDKTPLTIWGSGNAVRQFVYSEDVARLLLEMLGKAQDPKTLIVAPDQGVTIGALAEKVARVMGFEGEILFDTAKPEGQKARVLRSTRFSKLFPDFQFTPLEDALRQTAEWFVKNYPAVRGCRPRGLTRR